MRNLKKILALALALVMTLSLMTVANAFNDDSQIDAKYDEAVTVLSNLKVFKGVNDGSNFAPKQTITRGEVAAIIYRIVTGDVNDANIAQFATYAENTFSDVKATDWYAGYIGYCANAQLIVGDGNGRFLPATKVNGYQALAMILRAIGYDANKEFQGNGWEIRTASTAQQLGLLKNIGASSLSADATREMVAEILFRTIAEAYVVKYTTAFGYQPVYLPASENQTDVLAGDRITLTLGYQQFGLEKISGEITAVGRTAGTTTLVDHSTAANGTALDPVTVTGTSTPWTDIGYAAYVYTVPTAGAKTRAAVSDVVITGKSLGVNTAATPDGSFGSIKVATLDNNYHVYYNGVLLNKYYDGQSVPTTGYWFDASDMELMNGRNRVDIVNGLKVDFVDNDNGGKAEAIVFTEYTVAQVSGIATETNTGSNAYIPNTYYFSTMSLDTNKTVDVKADNMVSASTLAVGELVTYVQYAGDTYVTVAPSASGVFTQINYDRVTGNAISYVIGGTTYVKANDEEIEIAYVQDYYQGNDSVLTTNDVANKATLIVYTDPYGYMLYVDYAPVNAQYAYVVTNEDTDRIPGTTNTKVVYTDGSVNTLTISSAKVSTGTVMTDFDRNDVDLVDHIYTVAGSNLAYACAGHYYDSVYVNGTSYLEQGAYLTNTSVIVDVRGVLNGTATSATVYTGYGELPTMYNVTMHYVTDARGFVTVAYLTAGQNDASKEFVVYTTGANYFNGTTNKYNLPVIMDGQKTTLDLTPGEYEMIGELGVGLYEYNIDGTIKTFSGYTSFCEEWYSVDWEGGAIVLKDYFGAGRDYSVAYGDDVHFWTLDIDKGEAYGYNMLRGDDIHAYVVRDGNKVTDIYVIKGDVTTTGVKATYTKPVVVGGEVGYYEYYKQDKFVTRVEFVPYETFATAIPTADVVGAEETSDVVNSAGTIRTLTLSYQEYLNAVDEDGNVTLTIEAADGNEINIPGQTEWSNDTLTATLAVQPDGSAYVLRVNSKGDAASAAIVEYRIRVIVTAPDNDATLTEKVANARVEEDTEDATKGFIGYVGNGTATKVELTTNFVPTAAYATVEWTIDDATTGETYEYDYDWVNGTAEVTKDTIPVDYNTDPADTITVKVTAEDSETDITYTLTEIWTVSVTTYESGNWTITADSVSVFSGEDATVTLNVVYDATWTSNYTFGYTVNGNGSYTTDLCTPTDNAGTVDITISGVTENSVIAITSTNRQA